MTMHQVILTIVVISRQWGNSVSCCLQL